MIYFVTNLKQRTDRRRPGNLVPSDGALDSGGRAQPQSHFPRATQCRNEHGHWQAANGFYLRHAKTYITITVTSLLS